MNYNDVVALIDAYELGREDRRNRTPSSLPSNSSQCLHDAHRIGWFREDGKLSVTSSHIIRH